MGTYPYVMGQWNMYEFTQEVESYKRITLGEREDQFLRFFFYQPLSAYDILKILRDDLKAPMGYKDVHKRVKRLESLALIKKQGEQKRNKILYKLTSRGLFQVFLGSSYFPIPSALKKHKDDLILWGLIYQFFDKETIKKFITFPRVVFLRDYLRKCSQSLMSFIDPEIIAKKEIRAEDIAGIVKEEVKDLVFQIVTSSIKGARSKHIPIEVRIMQIQRYDVDEMEDENGPNYTGLFPRPALKVDTKFMKLLKEIKNDFDEGCKYYLEF